ncbi:class I ribonucleotide reductase maintenance protein YfaE [Denitrificimonas caeni]|uniref:class I ribonucleotide reductase maintenance protein YfaE n=1 Tax=Denitrificimonas caeni TaxID=521720 RepID=UPI0019627CB2|nr:class I ribonucleotide reductase maintenance protein YfaE [Denitrificimonas caeni]
MQVITEDLIFQLDESETLLEGLERTGHQVEYQCRSGYCGSCRVTLRAGSVDYEKPPLAYLRRDEILPCCCRVLEPLVIKVQLKSKYSA